MVGFWRDRFELNRGGGQHNLRVMEGARGLAVFLVFLVHYCTMVMPWIGGSGAEFVATRLHRLGNVGVDIFFVLSGYLIYGSLIERVQPFGAYMRRRVVRIYPAFLAVFALYLALSFLFPSQSKLPAGAFDLSLYLLQNLLLLPGLFRIEPMITVAWSLSYELFYYLAIPLVIGLLDLRNRSVAFRLGFFGLSVLALLLSHALFLEWTRLVLFLSGVLVFELIRSGRIRITGDAVAVVAFCVMLATTQFRIGSWLSGFIQLAAHFSALTVFCLAIFQCPQGLLGRLLGWTPLRWLGNMSYSYYLLHGLVMKTFFIVLPHLLQPPAAHGSLLFWLGLPLVFLVTLPPCIALFLTVERPFSLAPGRPRAQAKVVAAPL